MYPGARKKRYSACALNDSAHAPVYLCTRAFMDITGLGHAVSLEAPMATAMALSMLCGTVLAQSVIALPTPDLSLAGADPTSRAAPVKSIDPRESRLVSDDAEQPANGEMIQRQLRSLGAVSNGAPQSTRSDIEAEPWQNLGGLQAAVEYRTEMSEISSRWWFSVGRTDVGFGVGSVVLTARLVAGAAAPDVAFSGIVSVPSASLSVGMRRRTPAVPSLYAESADTRSMAMGTSGNGNGNYWGQVGVEWKTAEPRLSVAYSGLGVRLSSQFRMTVNLRKGGLGIYLRSQF